MWKLFLPKALKEGMYIIASQPLIVEKRGLEGVQVGYDILKRGVSTRSSFW